MLVSSLIYEQFSFLLWVFIFLFVNCRSKRKKVEIQSLRDSKRHLNLKHVLRQSLSRSFSSIPLILKHLIKRKSFTFFSLSLRFVGWWIWWIFASKRWSYPFLSLQERSCPRFNCWLNSHEIMKFDFRGEKSEKSMNQAFQFH